MKRVFLRDISNIRRLWVEKGKEKFTSSLYQEKIKKIITHYGLGSAWPMVCRNYISGELSEKYFLSLDLESARGIPIRQVVEKQKPSFVICKSSNEKDKFGTFGQVYIPIDAEIRISDRDHVSGLGINCLLKQLDYKLVQPKFFGDISVWEFGNNGDRSVLTAHLGEAWDVSGIRSNFEYPQSS